MAEVHKKLNEPVLVQGIALADLPNGGMFVHRCGDEQVLLMRRKAAVFAKRLITRSWDGVQ